MYSQECLVGMCHLVLQILTLFETKKCYCKIILKISPRLIFFQRPFLRGLFLEGLLFGGAYLRREICIPKSIALALQMEGNLSFFLCFTLYLRAISKYKPPRGHIFGGAYFWNFTVFSTPGVFRRGLRPLKSIPVFKPGIGRI